MREREKPIKRWTWSHVVWTIIALPAILVFLFYVSLLYMWDWWVDASRLP